MTGGLRWGGERMTIAARWVLVVLVATLVAKLVVIKFDGPIYDLKSDDRSYLVTAKLWLETGRFTYNDPNNPTVFIMPAFPAMVAGVMHVWGEGHKTEQRVRALQALLVTAGLWGLFAIGRRISSEGGAALGVIIAALYPPLWVMSNFILTEALFFFTLVLLVLAAIRGAEKGTPGSAVAFGLAWLAAVYVRPTIALWPGLLFLLLLAWRPLPVPRLIRCGVVAAAVFVVGMSPWWVRNYMAIGEFVPLTRSSGGPLWLGTYPDQQPSLEDQVKFHAPYPTLLQQDAFDRAWAIQRIKEGFRTEPLKWARWYTIGKFNRLWEIPYYWLPLPGVSYEFVLAMHRFMLVTTLLGLWLLRRNRPALLVLSLVAYMTVLHMIFLGHGRYSAPLMPFLALFVGHVLMMLKNLGAAPRDFRGAHATPAVDEHERTAAATTASREGAAS